MKMNLTKGGWWVVAVLVAGGAAFAFWGGASAPKAPARPPAVVTLAPAERRDVAITIREVANVVPYESVAIKSRLDSQIMEVHFNDGDKVQQGDLLFVLDDRSLSAQLKQMQANLERDRAQLENARIQFERTKKLADSGYAATSKLDDTRAAFETQKATVHATQASVDTIKTQLAYTRITAPITGRTGTITVTRGNNVKANDTQPLVIINQISPIRVQTSLPQQHFSALRTALQQGAIPVLATSEKNEPMGEGEVDYLDNAVDQATGSFNLRARFENTAEMLWPGMFVTLTLNLGQENNALVVPEVAVQQGQDGSFVFVVRECKAFKQPVTTSRIVDKIAVITQGLEDGSAVVVDGMLALKEGAPVVVSGENSPCPAKP
jgi:RND family efflux transporter MFP subunit